MKTIGIWIYVPTHTDPNARRWEFSHTVTWSEYERRAREISGEGSTWKAALARM